MELSASFFYIYNPFSSVTDKRKNRHLLFFPLFPVVSCFIFHSKKKNQTDFPSLFRMAGEGGGTRRCAHPAPASAFRERKAERGGGGRGGDGTERGGRGAVPARRWAPAPLRVGAAGGFPRRGPRTAPLRALRRCLSLLPCRKATSRRSRSAGKRQSRPNSSSSPSSPSPASPGSWQLRGSSTASGTAPTTGSRRSSRPWGLTPDPTPPLLIR